MESFFPKYPSIHANELDLYDQSFNDAIVNKREFKELVIPPLENVPKRGDLYTHQKIVQRFISDRTPYNELLLFHEMGTGKTCTAIGVVEALKKTGTYTNAMVFTRGENLGRNFMNELVFKCTDGQYVPDQYNALTDLERIRRINKLVGPYYKWHTMETFVRLLSKMTDANIKNRYSNTIVIIDEVHHLRRPKKASSDVNKDDLNMYYEFKRFLSLILNRKILLLSGTPMTDRPGEIADVMNLILPKELQFTSQTFESDYLQEEDGAFKESMVSDFSNRIAGRVSYLKSMTSNVKKVFRGSREIPGEGTLTHFKVVKSLMSPFQQNKYEEAYARDKQERGVYNYSRQASLFVFPDGTYGTEGFSQSKYVTFVAKNNTYRLGPDLISAIHNDMSQLLRLASKYAYIIQRLIHPQMEGKSMVYCEFVNGGGCILFSLLLEHFGFTKARGNETTPAKRYALVTTQTTSAKQFQRLLTAYNDPKNVNGDYISVIIGSRVLSEGITLKNVSHEFILTPHWNNSETEQVISRGWRVGSHNDMIAEGKNPILTIYRMVSTLENSDIPSIDFTMYKLSERKDIAIKHVERLMKQTAFDCPLTLERNQLHGMDDMRECDYMKCDYTCSGAVTKKTDNSTYNLYYSNPDRIKSILTEYFEYNSYITIKELRMLLPKNTQFNTLKVVSDLMAHDVQIINNYGFHCYLREENDKLYLSTDPSKTHDQFDRYYSDNLLLKSPIAYSNLVESLYMSNLPSLVKALFEHHESVHAALIDLPLEVQLLILQAAIQAKNEKATKNVAIRKAILTFFQGFYGSVRGQDVIWYAQDILPPTIFNGRKWVPYTRSIPKGPIPEDNNEVPMVDTQEDIPESTIGFYGLYNPQIDAFCIRRVGETTKVDLRKLKPGKMCKDWSLKELAHIAAVLMKILPPVTYLENHNRHQLQVAVNKIKYYTDTDTTEMSNDDMRTLVYWSTNTRKHLCEAIHGWFQTHGLLRRDYDCGHQQKKRFRTTQT